MSDPPRGPKGDRGDPGMPRAARYAVVFLFAASFLLAGASYWLAVRAVRGEVASRASLTQLCQAGNESRAQQVTLWTHLIQISQPPPRETPAQQARRLAETRVFLAYITKVFAARACPGDR